jgi:hypothetical protein
MRKRKQLGRSKWRSARYIECRLQAADNLEMDVYGWPAADASDNSEL